MFWIYCSNSDACEEIRKRVDLVDENQTLREEEEGEELQRLSEECENLNNDFCLQYELRE